VSFHKTRVKAVVVDVASSDHVNITAGTFATSSLCWVLRQQAQLLIVICSPCTMTSITCIDVVDHSHAQTLWACLGASENVFPPKAWPDCGILLAGRRLRLGNVNYMLVDSRSRGDQSSCSLVSSTRLLGSLLPVLLCCCCCCCCYCCRAATGTLNFIRHAPLCYSFGRRLKSVNLAKMALAQAGRLPLC
jgi:hypothetical protein